MLPYVELDGQVRQRTARGIAGDDLIHALPLGRSDELARGFLQRGRALSRHESPALRTYAYPEPPEKCPALIRDTACSLDNE